ncbi:Ribosomal RNA large subunit methyltransferase K/L [Dissostichus eleginoides]|uniref:Ribosomal RNA large subunit methyltransferase K/L n=1 Tax=Dissostichus eleginoides TaxID=100907 RepID=A0AAD9C6S2_DISEL|nr:Ribosomal RNA large subunit methyltransferase K/L [Dissostichus eleginoides]
MSISSRLPEIQRTTLPAEIVTTDVTERSPFKLVDMENKVQQIWVKTEEDLRKVTAEHPVAVLFGHSCTIYHNCTLGSCSAHCLQPKATSCKTDFASCYVVNTISNTDGYAVIVVHKDLADGVRVRNDPLESALWQDLKGTDFRSASVALSTGKSAIWHTSSKMAVYFVGNKENARFGNPAAILSHIPDFRGCVLSPEIVRIGTKADGWRESLKNCTDDQLDLVSFPETILQTPINRPTQTTCRRCGSACAAAPCPGSGTG